MVSLIEGLGGIGIFFLYFIYFKILFYQKIKLITIKRCWTPHASLFLFQITQIFLYLHR
jgi:hypothetical protein